MQSPVTTTNQPKADAPGLSLLEINGAMSSRLIHDLTNLISSVVGNAEYAAHILQGDDRLAKAIDAIRVASNRSGKMLAQYGQIRRRIAEHTRVCSTAEVAVAIQDNLNQSSGWRVHVPENLGGSVRVHPEWLARVVAQILIDSGSRAGRVDIAEGALEHPWHWRGSGASPGLFQVFVRYRSQQPLFGEDGPLNPEIPGTVAVWELMRSFRGQINARVSGPEQQEIAILLPQI